MTGTPDIHVDWHMTPAEWDELRGILLRNTGYEYIGKLEAAGALGTALVHPHREPQPAPELVSATQERHPGREVNLLADDEPQPGPSRAELETAMAVELAKLAAERNQYRIALERISGYAAGTATKRMIGDTARKALDQSEPLQAPKPQPAPELAQVLADLREAQHAASTHRERLAMLLADTPFEFRPDWASEYEDADSAGEALDAQTLHDSPGSDL